jgi:hypothetical protein
MERLGASTSRGGNHAASKALQRSDDFGIDERRPSLNLEP